MKIQVNDQGVLIPKDFFAEIKEVEIRRQENIIMVIPIVNIDPIVQLGTEPIDIEIVDASVNHDYYLYG
jgi:virulence-associated protein VagC